MADSDNLRVRDILWEAFHPERNASRDETRALSLVNEFLSKAEKYIREPEDEFEFQMLNSAAESDFISVLDQEAIANAYEVVHVGEQRLFRAKLRVIE